MMFLKTCFPNHTKTVKKRTNSQQLSHFSILKIFFPNALFSMTKKQSFIHPSQLQTNMKPKLYIVMKTTDILPLNVFLYHMYSNCKNSKTDSILTINYCIAITHSVTVSMCGNHEQGVRHLYRHVFFS